METLENSAPDIAAIVTREEERQRNEINLIASENIVSEAILTAQGSVLTNKYAEGYPGKRYYGGCEVVDEAENLARDRAKELFGATMPMFSPIQELRRTLPPTLLFSNRVTRFWRWISPTVDICRTVQR